MWDALKGWIREQGSLNLALALCLIALMRNGQHNPVNFFCTLYSILVYKNEPIKQMELFQGIKDPYLTKATEFHRIGLIPKTLEVEAASG